MQSNGKSFIKFFLSPKGRIKRLPFLFGIVPLSAFLYFLSRIFNGRLEEIEALSILLVMLMGVLLLLWAYWILHIKRLHDVNLSGWFSLINLIPIINIFFFLFLLFKKAVDPNKYTGMESLKKEAHPET